MREIVVCEWCLASDGIHSVEFPYFTMAVCNGDLEYAVQQGGRLVL